MRSLALFVCLLACSSKDNKPAAAEPAAERQLRGWLDAFNSGDRAKLAAFHQAYWPFQKEDPQGDGEMGFREATGGFELKKV